MIVNMIKVLFWPFGYDNSSCQIYGRYGFQTSEQFHVSEQN
jgi:hypothetical protein